MTITTGSAVAEIAARGLAHPGALDDAEIRSVCGSALAQYEGGGGWSPLICAIVAAFGVGLMIGLMAAS